MRRREFCETVAAGAATATGASVLAGTASAHPGSIPVVSTRDHFDVSWDWSFWDDGFYEDELRDEYSKYEYEVSGEIPSDVEELAVIVHGWSNDPEGAADMFETTASGLRDQGYEGGVAGFSYDASVDFLKVWEVGKWWAHFDVARRNGLKLASFLHSYSKDNPNTTLRLVGHSLGGQPMVNALKALDVTSTSVATVSNLGAAIPDEEVSLDGAYGSAIEANCESYNNYYMDDDLVLDKAFSIAQLNEAVGEEGCDGPQPDNYTDYDVGDVVGSHFGYYESGGCLERVVGDW